MVLGFLEVYVQWSLLCRAESQQTCSQRKMAIQSMELLVEATAKSAGQTGKDSAHKRMRLKTFRHAWPIVVAMNSLKKSSYGHVWAANVLVTELVCTCEGHEVRYFSSLALYFGPQQ